MIFPPLWLPVHWAAAGVSTIVEKRRTVIEPNRQSVWVQFIWFKVPYSEFKGSLFRVQRFKVIEFLVLE
jgi:hypothetical protein